MTPQEHLQEFADLFVKAWSMWAGQDGCTPVEMAHLEREMDNVFWSEMIIKWGEMLEDGVIKNSTSQFDDDVERAKNSPVWMIPEHLRGELA